MASVYLEVDWHVTSVKGRDYLLNVIVTDNRRSNKSTEYTTIVDSDSESWANQGFIVRTTTVFEETRGVNKIGDHLEVPIRLYIQLVKDEKVRGFFILRRTYEPPAEPQEITWVPS